VREAVSEIRKVRRTDPVLAAEGAVLFLERISPALEHVDSSSGAIGTAVNHAIEELVAVIAQAPAKASKRAEWLERLWEAYVAEPFPTSKRSANSGASCAQRKNLPRPGRTASSMSFGRIGKVGIAPRALFSGHARMPFVASGGKPIRGAPGIAREGTGGLVDIPSLGRSGTGGAGKESGSNTLCRSLMRAQRRSGCDRPRLRTDIAFLGLAEEAYERCAISANRNTSYLASYRAIVRKYPHKEPAQILRDLVRSTPGEHGKWFAAAKDAGLFDLAIELANYSPCDPRTLARAARDFEDENPSRSRFGRGHCRYAQDLF
jgi:hypothetical protein